MPPPYRQSILSGYHPHLHHVRCTEVFPNSQVCRSLIMVCAKAGERSAITQRPVGQKYVNAVK
jgi:hypothetical protein